MRKHSSNGRQQKNSAVGDQQKPAGSVQSSTDGEVACPSPTEDSTTTRLRQLLPTAWNMIRPYWSSEDRWAAWGLLVVVVALTLGMVYISVLFNQWNNAFYTRPAGQEPCGLSPAAVRVFVAGRPYHLFRRLPALSQPDARDPLAALADRPLPPRLAGRRRLLSDAARGA